MVVNLLYFIDTLHKVNLDERSIYFSKRYQLNIFP